MAAKGNIVGDVAIGLGTEMLSGAFGFVAEPGLEAFKRAVGVQPEVLEALRQLDALFNRRDILEAAIKIEVGRTNAAIKTLEGVFGSQEEIVERLRENEEELRKNLDAIKDIEETSDFPRHSSPVPFRKKADELLSFVGLSGDADTPGGRLSAARDRRRPRGAERA